MSVSQVESHRTVVDIRIIDDGYPTGSGVELETLDLKRITSLIDADWSHELSLRDLNIDLNGEASRSRNRISLTGYTHPSIFRDGLATIKPNFVIYDWEYRIPTQQIQDLTDILSRSDAEIVVFSAFDKVDQIGAKFRSDPLQSYWELNRLSVIEKGDDDQIEKLLKRIVQQLQNGYPIDLLGSTFKFVPNKYLMDETDLWKLVTVIGKPSMELYFSTREKEINEGEILSLFEGSEQPYYLSGDRRFLFSSTCELYVHRFGNLTEISSKMALTTFGIDKLEMARERGYTEAK